MYICISYILYVLYVHYLCGVYIQEINTKEYLALKK